MTVGWLFLGFGAFMFAITAPPLYRLMRQHRRAKQDGAKISHDRNARMTHYVMYMWPPAALIFFLGGISILTFVHR
jgi:uncharacterized membrane protein SpoIIM required for sporulation